MEGCQKWFNSQLCTSLKPQCYTINRKKIFKFMLMYISEGRKFYMTYYLAFLTLFLVFSPPPISLGRYHLYNDIHSKYTALQDH